jgi:hypothetical protein
MKRFFLAVLIISPLLFSVFFSPKLSLAAAPTEIRSIFFPTDPSVTFTDDFGDARSGHKHEANDLMGKKMMPLYAAVNGRVSYLVIPEASWGYEISLQDADGYTYNYIHVNNDTPGTDDDKGGVEHAYAPGIVEGATVVKGQLIGWMGDSGNAENVGPHLHFEIRMPDDTAIDPYLSLRAALAQNTINYDVKAVLSGSLNINADKGLASSSEKTVCVSGTLLKTATVAAVYYCGNDGKRHVFTNDKAYFTWYKDFSTVKIISLAKFAAIPLGSNVTYRPGVKLLKIPSSSTVYAVDKNGVLRSVGSDATATALYGADWKNKIDDIPESFFTNYTIGEPILLVASNK